MNPAPLSAEKTIAASPEPHNDANVVRTDNVAEIQDTAKRQIVSIPTGWIW